MLLIKRLLTLWGAISGLLLITIWVYFSYQFNFQNKAKINSASSKDITHILNWARLGGNRVQSVLHSYESSRSFTGDHLDIYAIQTTGISEDELQNTDLWSRGDQLDAISSKGVSLVNSFISSNTDYNWFPNKEQLMSKRMYITSWSISFHSKQATSAQIIFVNPATNIVYYASVKT